MRLLLVAATAAVLVAASTATEIQTADVAPLLTAIPGVGDALGLADVLGLPNILEILPPTLLSPETAWDKVRGGLALTGVIIIEIAAFIGYIFNYLDKIQTANEEQREAAAEEEAQAAAIEEAVSLGESRYSVVPHHEPAISPVINLRPAALRRVATHPAAPYAKRHPTQYAAYQGLHPSRPQPSRPYRRRVQKRSAAPSTTDGVLGRVVEAGKQILWLLKKLFLKEAQQETVAKEMTEVLDKLTEGVMQQLDGDGCLQKLVCYLQEKPRDALTNEEKMLQVFFPLRRSHTACTDDLFPRCFLSAPDLDTLLTRMPTPASNVIF